MLSAGQMRILNLIFCRKCQPPPCKAWKPSPIVSVCRVYFSPAKIAPRYHGKKQWRLSAFWTTLEPWAYFVLCWSWIWCDRSGKIQSWQSIYTTRISVHRGNEDQVPSHFFHPSVNLKCIFKWTVGLFGSINYSNCFLHANHIYEMWKPRVCTRECWRVWDQSSSPLKIFFLSLEMEPVMSNNIYSEDFNAPCCPIVALPFTWRLKPVVESAPPFPMWSI